MSGFLQRKSQSVSTKTLRKAPVDVVITCHNYGRFLRECVESIQQQDIPTTIVVVDDASDDDTPQVASELSCVTYVRIEARDVCSARYAGLVSGSSPYVLFMDADNTLLPGYLANAVDILESDHRIGIVSCNLLVFGNQSGLVQLTDKFSNQSIRLANSLDTGCVARRTALIQSKAVQPHTGRNMLTAEDWVMWRRLLDSGNWLVTANPIPLHYRRHGDCLSSSRKTIIENSPRPFYEDYGLAHETVTVFTIYSRRNLSNPQLWKRRLEWLRHQTWPKLQVRLVVANTSWRDVFPSTLGFDNFADFAGAAIYRHDVGRGGLEDEDRRNPIVENEVQHAVAAIYNRMLKEVATDFVLILEDDVFPEDFDFIERMLSQFDTKTFAVSGIYRQRYTDAWSTYPRNAILSPAHLHKERGDGVEVIGGAGFGCLMLRTSQCQGDVFVACEKPSKYYDVHWFFTKLRERPDMICKVDWNSYCEHEGVRYFQ